MFLLILKSGSTIITAKINFTFHYVSINTWFQKLSTQYIMYFTFHYVSINTGATLAYTGGGKDFTFHYVSINTIFTRCCCKVHNSLYIPLCFY